jgi:hypothetical protein
MLPEPASAILRTEWDSLSRSAANHFSREIEAAMDKHAGEAQGALALASAPSGTGSGGHEPPDPKLKRSTMTRLGQVLRNEYAPLMQEPIPEALLALLNPGADTKPSN